jgi:hypothetical protein
VETFEELSTPGKPDETASMSLLFNQIANYWTRAQYLHAQCHASKLRGFGDLPAPISSGTHIHATERSLKDYWQYLPETKARCLAILTRLKVRLGGGIYWIGTRICGSRRYDMHDIWSDSSVCVKAPERWFELAGETYVYGIMMEKQWVWGWMKKTSVFSRLTPCNYILWVVVSFTLDCL